MVVVRDAQRRHATLPAVAVVLGALFLFSYTLSGPCFLPPTLGFSLSTTATLAGPNFGVTQGMPGRRSLVSRPAEKSLFEKTKNLNREIQEANSSNELLFDTDALWGVAYLVAGVLATWFFVSVLYGLKPTP